MKRIFLFIILIGLIVTLFSDFLSDLWPRTIYAQEVSSSTTQQQIILSATIQITLFGQATADQTNVTIARGLGTLVHYDAQTLIVTHDHWGDFVVTTNSVEFRDAQSQLLLAIDGIRFRSLVLYRDEGTMILSAPPELSLNQAAFLNQDDIKPGTVVTVAHHQQGPDGRITIETMSATIMAVEQHRERPIYMLRSLDGQPVIQGDSGGGVWWNGRLIGNTWATEMITGWRVGNWSISSDDSTTTTSITAQFPQLSPQGEAGTDWLDPVQSSQIYNGLTE